MIKFWQATNGYRNRTFGGGHPARPPDQQLEWKFAMPGTRFFVSQSMVLYVQTYVLQFHLDYTQAHILIHTQTLPQSVYYFLVTSIYW